MKLQGKPLLVMYLVIAFSLITGGSLLMHDIGVIKIPGLFPSPTAIPSPQPPQDSVLFPVKRVIDGDTIELESGERVRYIGIDTPETKHPVKKLQCYGKEASQKNSELVAGKFIRMEKDVSDLDRYGRLLRYVFVYETPQATGEAVFVNEKLVREGYAYASTYPPDVAYADLFKSSQEEAEKLNRGLWNSCQ